MIFSHSQLETYENCPFKYHLQYRERVKAERRSIEAFMGSVVHATLERLYRDLLMSRLPELEEVRENFLRMWDASFGEDVFIVRKEYGPEDYRNTGLRCVEDYYRRYYPFRGGVPLWLERRVNIPLKDSEGRLIAFSGVLDRLDGLDGGVYEIHDYKTSQSLPTQEDLMKDRQLSLYQLAVEEAFPDAVQVDLVWHYLAFDREARLRRNREDLRRIAEEAAELVRRIETAEDFPPRESELCEWCEVQEYCPKRKHIYMVAELPARELGTDRGIQLVDQYLHWYGMKKEAEERLEALREEILEFSAFHGADNLQGSSCVLAISRSSQLKLPPAGSGERQRLEVMLRESGVWDEVSVLNARKLGSLYRGGGLDSDLKDRLKEFMSWEEVATIRIRGGESAD